MKLDKILDPKKCDGKYYDQKRQRLQLTQVRMKQQVSIPVSIIVSLLYIVLYVFSRMFHCFMMKTYFLNMVGGYFQVGIFPTISILEVCFII